MVLKDFTTGLKIRETDNDSTTSNKKRTASPNLPSGLLAVLCSYHISGYIRGAGSAMVQLECIAFPFLSRLLMFFHNPPRHGIKGFF